MNRVKDKVALVTGGAVGLGEAQAKLLAKEGAKVVVSDINAEDGKRTAKEIQRDGGEAIFVKHDVTSEEQWAATVRTVLDAFKQLDVLVNNAGIGIAGNVEETTLKDWHRLQSVNLDGVFLGVREAIKVMKNNNGGSIINLSSIEGIIGDPVLAAYNASKGGVRLLTKSAALYCAKAGYKIRVNSVHPGYIWTPMVASFLSSHGDVEEGRARLASLHPVGHVGEPVDVAYGVLYLASDESKFVTGSELVIDGGYTAQ